MTVICENSYKCDRFYCYHNKAHETLRNNYGEYCHRYCVVKKEFINCKPLVDESKNNELDEIFDIC